ncbi:hypothetical protein K0A97_01435 [Patescibacteria group bacterium]|nr:hypothetical protein [Patescibacteria group bacterium]
MSEDKNLETRIKAIIILEVIGKPPEHLVETLEKLAEGIGNEKGVFVISKKINKSVLLKDQKDFYSNFAEIELEVNELLQLLFLMFKYMPAHVEIVSPETIKTSNNDFGEVLNELLRRLHVYDEIARIMQLENKKLMDKLKVIEEKEGDESPKDEKKKD